MEEGFGAEKNRRGKESVTGPRDLLSMLRWKVSDVAEPWHRGAGIGKVGQEGG